MKRKHAKAVREVATAIDRRLGNMDADYNSEHHVEVTGGREPIIKITIKVKS